DVADPVGAQARRRVEYTRVLADDVPDPAPEDRVAERGQRAGEIVDLAQRRDAQLPRRLLAGAPPRGVLVVDMPVRRAGIDDENGEIGSCRVAGDVLNGETPAVEKQHVPVPAEGRRGLIHDPAWDTDIDVLGPLSQSGAIRHREIESAEVT